MAKEFYCKDVVPGCNAVIKGKDEKEVMAKAAEHARDAHNITNLPPDVQQKVRQNIHNT